MKELLCINLAIFCIFTGFLCFSACKKNYVKSITTETPIEKKSSDIEINIEENPYSIIDELNFDGKTFPIIYVNVDNESEITSKENYLSCIVSIVNANKKYVFYGENAKTAKIKGRGNSSWLMPKKSYTLKFNSKTDLFGFGEAKKYTLIANYCDKSLSRNLFAYSIAQEIGLSCTSLTQPINLVVNNQYLGVYLLCELNEIGSNRVDIENDLTKIDTGYLIELDQQSSETGIINEDYFTIGEYNYIFKDPEIDDKGFTSEHFQYVKQYMERCFETINGNSYLAVKRLIDVESFAKCYIIHELFNCVDVGYSSFFLYKKQSGSFVSSLINGAGKLFAGPVWDFDISSGNCKYVADANNHEYLYAKNANPWYNKLLEFNEFKALVASILTEYKNVIESKINELAQYQIEHIENNNANFIVWQILDEYVWPNPEEIVELNTFEQQLLYLKDWLNSKLNYMIDVYIVD